MFYTFDQNNSGGTFYGDEYVIVEAASAEEANNLAKEYDIYFNGVEEDRDCECCGDRWDRVNDHDGTFEPLIYGQPVQTALDNKSNYFGKTAVVYYLNGQVERFNRSVL